MSEVAKLYKNAGVEPRYIGCYYNLPCCRNCNKNYKDTIGKTCKYQIVKEEYPPFTAEKQLEIVKLILFSKWWMSLKICQFAEKFDERLAELVNDIWQDLTEQERTEIAEILRG